MRPGKLEIGQEKRLRTANSVAYALITGMKIWIVTASDRWSTVLLPAETEKKLFRHSKSTGSKCVPFLNHRAVAFRSRLVIFLLHNLTIHQMTQQREA
jgi:hypothetical protein